MAAPSTHQQDVLAFLASPAAYGPQCTHVDRIDTHISVVFLTEDRAYKLKHDVHFPYVDLLDPERTARLLRQGTTAVLRRPDGRCAFRFAPLGG